SFADVQGNLTDDAGGNAVLTLGAGQTITLNGVDANSLTASNFEFDQQPAMDNEGTLSVDDGAMLPLSGEIINHGTIALNSTGSETLLQVVQHAVTLEGSGQVILSDSDGNEISGSAPDVSLVNVNNTLSGAGQLGAGQMVLVNHGSIVADGSHVLTID